MLPRPLVVVNVKTYPQGTGEALDDLLETVADEAPGEPVAFAVQAPDVRRAVGHGLPVLGQHVDPDPLGSHTGAIAPEALRDAGAVGSLVNHAEKQVPMDHVEGAVKRLQAHGLASLVCADSVETARTVAGFGPDLVAVEPPELIGGDVSVTSADPGIVEDAVAAVRDVDPNVDVLCGAGVKTGDDVATAIELGTVGVLLASAVAKADDPGAAVSDLLGGLP